MRVTLDEEMYVIGHSFQLDRAVTSGGDLPDDLCEPVRHIVRDDWATIFRAPDDVAGTEVHDVVIRSDVIPLGSPSRGGVQLAVWTRSCVTPTASDPGCRRSDRFSRNGAGAGSSGTKQSTNTRPATSRPWRHWGNCSPNCGAGTHGCGKAPRSPNNPCSALMRRHSSSPTPSRAGVGPDIRGRSAPCRRWSRAPGASPSGRGV